MSLVLDSNVLIVHERAGANAQQALTIIASRYPGQELCISVITLTELAHGAARADSAIRRSTRSRFMEELLSALAVHPVTPTVAMRAGHINGENAAKGLHLGLADLLIGITALELGFGVVTKNMSHFEMIPGLEVLPY